MATSTFTHNLILSVRNLKNARKNAKTSNKAYKDDFRKENWLAKRLLGVLGSQGIVVNVQPPSLSVRRIVI